jgi:hypothetical protein
MTAAGEWSSVWCPICAARPGQACESALGGQKVRVPHTYRRIVARSVNAADELDFRAGLHE